MLAVRHVKYLGSFPVGGAGVDKGEGAAARVDYVSRQLHLMKETGHSVPVLVVIALSGVKICDPEDQSVRMTHALRRISYATCEGARALFAFVAREPNAHRDPSCAPSCASSCDLTCERQERERETDLTQQYCHAFHTDTPEQAEELNCLVGNAFRMAFTSQLQPSAPLWSKELSCSDSGGGGMGVRAPGSLPGLTHHYPTCFDRSPPPCDLMGATRLINETSPSSSEESNSPTEVNSYRRLGERPPLMKRLALGFSGALLQPSDDDSTPLVADTPTTPTNLPLCLNGYINEASDAEARTRASNRAPLTHPPLPAHPSHVHHFAHLSHSPHQTHHGPPPVPPAPPYRDHFTRDDFKQCNGVKTGSPRGPSSRATSASVSSSASSASCGAASGASGASSASGVSLNNNNHAPRAEPELRHAPWFQAGIPREIALEVLATQPLGAFLVRSSTTQGGCFALSVRVPADFHPAGLAHYLILRTTKGYKIKGFTKEFTSLSALVTHHSVMPELLPVPLRLARPARSHAAALPPSHSHARHADLDALAPLHAQGYLKQLDV